MKINGFRIKASLTGALLCVVLSACGGVPYPGSTQPISPAGPAVSQPVSPVGTDVSQPVSQAVSPMGADELDAAVRETSDYLNGQLPQGNKLIILNIQSEFPALSEYIIDELIANTVNDRIFSVVDRQQLNTIRAELEFQASEEVDDNTAQALGRMAGAQIIISGAVSRIGDLYRLRVRALSVQTAQIEGQFNRNIPNGPTVSALVQSQATGYGNGSIAARPQQGAASAPAAPAVQTPVTPTPAVPAAQTPADPASEPATVIVQAEPAQPTAPVPVQPPVQPVPVPVVEAPAVPTTYNIGEAGPAGGTVFYPVVRTASVLPAATGNYNIGEAGPAGGTVFYPVVRTASVLPAATGNYNIGEAGPAGGTVFHPVVRTVSVPPVTTQAYRIGDTGPAGGIIFYVNPGAGEWKYLEVAPASTEGKALQWSVSNFDTGANRVEIGTGKQNTQNIVDTSLQVAVNAPAARLCDRLEYGGYDDWYLPSKNELGLMYMNLKVDGLGGFSSDWYWSSSESGNRGGAWTQNFGNGEQGDNGGAEIFPGYKRQGHNVRAIRQF